MAGAEPDDDPPPSRAAAASNWRQIATADLVMGVVVMVCGIAVMAFGQIVGGAGVAAAGLGYVLVVRRRRQRWVEWRRRHGLPV